jgi:MFS family permease
MKRNNRTPSEPEGWSRTDKLGLGALIISVLGLFSGIFVKEVHDILLGEGQLSSAFRMAAFVIAIVAAVVGGWLSQRSRHEHGRWEITTFVTVIIVSVVGIWLMRVEAAAAARGEQMSNTSKGIEIIEAASHLGLEQIEAGSYKTEENIRLGASIRAATNIKLLMPNASSFTQTFKNDLDAFFAKPGTSMQVIFATPGSVFYDEMTRMTFKKPWGPDEKAKKDNDDLIAFGKKRLLDDTSDESKIEVRYFDTEFRLPIIITHISDLNLRN